MKIAYTSQKFSVAVQKMIDKANEIIHEYQTQGYSLTLRQLYYQFVARDLVPNRQNEYKRLGSAINNGRLAGEIDWYAIEDRTRNLSGVQTWDTPSQILEACANSFKYDLWASQPNYVEVWCEKEALAGVFSRICTDLRVPYFSCRGYVSQSELWRAGRRLRKFERVRGQSTFVLHFGDHDPSGIDMTRDIQDRLHMFGASTEVTRLALNMNQVDQYNPPPNPAKLSDSRANKYVTEYGDDSWELDALEPSVLSQLVEMEVSTLRDEDVWQLSKKREQASRNQLQELADDWTEEYSHDTE